MQENRECVETNNVFDGILAILFSQLEFLVLDGPTGIGQVDRAVDQGRDTVPEPPPPTATTSAGLTPW